MTAPVIGVVGASGFVGSTFVEHLLAHGRGVRAFIRGSGNVWRLSRRADLVLEPLDLLAPADLARKLDGCSHVVNCSRGDSPVMLAGLENLLRASRAAGVARFVHISSVAVYGDPPPPESTDEDAPTRPEPGGYGATKLAQDRMVEAAAGAMRTVILCPPNISGCGSIYLLRLVEALRAGRLALVEGGRMPINLVDVENLAHAIERALVTEMPPKGRMFVTDGDDVTWGDVVGALAPLAEAEESPASLSREEAQRLARPPARPTGSLSRSLKHLASPEMSRLLRADPWLVRLDDMLRWPLTLLGDERKIRFKRWLAGPIRVEAGERQTPWDPTLLATQLRNVRHSCRRATSGIGYAPPLDFARSMDAFRRWYIASHGMDRPSWELARELLRA